MNTNMNTELSLTPTEEQAREAYRRAWGLVRRWGIDPADRAEVVQDAVARWATSTYQPGWPIKVGLWRALAQSVRGARPSCGHPDGDDSQSWREDALRSNWSALGEHCRRLADVVADPNGETLLDTILSGLRASNQWCALEAVCLVAGGATLAETCKQTGYTYYSLRQVLDDVSTLI